MLVLVHAAEEPVLVGYLTAHFIKKSGHGVEIVGSGVKQVFYLRGAFMRNDVINTQVVVEKIVNRLRHFLCGGGFLRPPFCAALLAKLKVCAAAAAHCKNSGAVDVVNLTAAEMNYVGFDKADSAAIPFGCGIFVESVKILMAAVNKKQGEFLLVKIVECLFLLTVSVPDEAEIAADDEIIALAELGNSLVVKS